MLVLSNILKLAVFHVSDHFWARENQCPKNKKTIFFQDKFYSFKAYAHYFSFIYLATWRTATLGIFIHFMFTNLPRCSQSRNSLIYVYTTQIPSCFLECLITVMFTLLRTTVTQKNFLYYPLTDDNCLEDKIRVQITINILNQKKTHHRQKAFAFCNAIVAYHYLSRNPKSPIETVN